MVYLRVQQISPNLYIFIFTFSIAQYYTENVWGEIDESCAKDIRVTAR